MIQNSSILTQAKLLVKLLPLLMSLTILSSCSITKAKKQNRVLTLDEINKLYFLEGQEAFEQQYRLDKWSILKDKTLNELILISMFSSQKSRNEIETYTLKKYSTSPDLNRLLYVSSLHKREFKNAFKYLKASSLNTEDPRELDLFFLYNQYYTPTVIPDKAEQLFESNSNWSSDTALIYVQGGPDFKIRKGREDALSYMEGSDSVLKIYPYNAPMINKSVFSPKQRLTKKESRFEFDKSVEILARVISHLKEQKKTIFLIGHSYGVTVISEYLSKENAPVEKVFLLGNRLNKAHEQELYDTLANGEIIRWEKGINPIVVTSHPLPDQFPQIDQFRIMATNKINMEYSSYERNKTDIIRPEYYNKIVLIYSDEDYAVGKVQEDEKQFLDSVGIEYYEIDKDHSGLISKGVMKPIWKNIKNDSSLEFSESIDSFFTPEYYHLARKIAKEDNSLKAEVGDFIIEDDIINDRSYHSNGYDVTSLRLKIKGKFKEVQYIVILSKTPDTDWKLIGTKRE